MQVKNNRSLRMSDLHATERGSDLESASVADNRRSPSAVRVCAAIAVVTLLCMTGQTMNEYSPQSQIGRPAAILKGRKLLGLFPNRELNSSAHPGRTPIEDWREPEWLGHYTFEPKETLILVETEYRCGELRDLQALYMYQACQRVDRSSEHSRLSTLYYQDWNQVKVLHFDGQEAHVENAPSCTMPCEENLNGKVEGGRCFFVPNKVLTATEASHYCHQHTAEEGNLASIFSEAENNVVWELFQQSGSLETHHGMWIGAVRVGGSGFFWVDGAAAEGAHAFSSWAEGEPNNFENNEDCAEMYYKPRTWNDDDCSKVQQFACVQPVESLYSDDCGIIEHVGSLAHREYVGY